MALTQEEFFLQRKEETEKVIGHISEERQELEVQVANPREVFAKLKADEREKFQFLYGLWTLRLHNDKFLEKSPFFVRLVVQFDDKNEQEIIYIGKFSFLTDKIYSWTVPVAGLRFATPGKFSYVRPNGQTRSGVVFNKEDYFIANGKIVSLHDVTEEGRHLIYDEHIAIKKTGFGLSDIVRELERAQNEIIVLDPKGLMVISGPAGSGKTTLALHRVAYLLQNPDTSELYKPESAMILIQDESSVSYFSSLFVNLGVEGVRFTTFEAWASSLLELPEHTYTDRFGNDPIIRDWYEWNKVILIRDMSDLVRPGKDSSKTLDTLYGQHTNEMFQKIWNEQKVQKVFDKQDLTALLKLQIRTDAGKVLQPKKVYKKKGRALVPVQTRAELIYDILLVDEFENYTADQLQMLNKTATPKTSMLFVGDIHQQTKFGSISDFSQSDLAVSEERSIVLSKVYRNSPSVIEILHSLGYNVLSGTQNTIIGRSSWVTENHSLLIREHLQKTVDEQVGVVCYDESLVDEMRTVLEEFSGRVHIGTVTEFQGLEFDTVFVLGVNRDLFTPTGLSSEFDRERASILRERLYVAITRARENVIVCSDSSQEEVKKILESGIL